MVLLKCRLDHPVPYAPGWGKSCSPARASAVPFGQCPSISAVVEASQVPTDQVGHTPALDAETGQVLPSKELFHGQCWRHMQAECARVPGAWFEVRAIASPELAMVIASSGGRLGSLVSASNVVVVVEDRVRAHRAALAPWLEVRQYQLPLRGRGLLAARFSD
jgi:hypothetical protein